MAPSMSVPLESLTTMSQRAVASPVAHRSAVLRDDGDSDGDSLSACARLSPRAPASGTSDSGATPGQRCRGRHAPPRPSWQSARPSAGAGPSAQGVHKPAQRCMNGTGTGTGTGSPSAAVGGSVQNPPHLIATTTSR